jgi:hypothetical protein
MAVCWALLAAYVGIGLAISVVVRQPAKAIVAIFLIWTASVALLDFAGIALLLRWRLPAQAVFLLAAANPVQAARLALLSSAEPTLATLGPVGFYLANHVGPGALLALGVAWPGGVGAASFGFACWRFRRGDLV